MGSIRINEITYRRLKSEKLCRVYKWRSVMLQHKTVLVVEDNEVNRKILKKILETEYTVLLAENGQVAFEILKKHGEQISAIILDIKMPVMDGYTFLEKIQKLPEYKSLPIIISTALGSIENEKKSLNLGAWDFVSKPYDTDILRFRLKNTIVRSQLNAFQQLKYMAEHDTLTGIYNKVKFLEITHHMLMTKQEKKFVFVRFDVNRFQLINSFFGADTGDRLLVYIANQMRVYIKEQDIGTFGRIEADVFAFCIPFVNEEQFATFIDKLKNTLKGFPLKYNIAMTFGAYLIQDNTEDTSLMLDKAALASKQVKGNFIRDYAFYYKELSEELEKEQRITNVMVTALEEGQFQIFLQPKYNLQTKVPAGAEALVRWFQPDKGMISPGDFLPIFERNGFIIKLDYYVWEEACKLLRRWLDEGKNPLPISVNVSRVNIYNPGFIESICDLAEKYRLLKSLLELEITESAYSDNPTMMRESIKQLQEKGFIILMDDFGSAYSSLNILKDIEMDILKIDMKFMENAERPGRSQNIIASIIRMAKWLHLPVVAEGVEKLEQVEFLRKIGCEYVQGYYFAKPMPVDQYESLIYSKQILQGEKLAVYNNEETWSPNKEMELLLSQVTLPLIIYEVSERSVKIIRVNQVFYDLFGHEDLSLHSNDPFVVVKSEFRDTFKQVFQETIINRSFSEYEYQRETISGKLVWIQIKLKYIKQIADKHIMVGMISDITKQKKCELELQKYIENSLLHV